ncbi:hypothetical protein HanPSC8_Chr13g0552081 [Helianthus annuus]|nr:hypothetical protein HanPSC8_Chr13g0552081 [Helianthus annuus]
MSSRFISVDFMPISKPNNEHLSIKHSSKAPFLKTKEYAWTLLGKSCINLGLWKNQQTTTFVRHNNVDPPPEASPLPSGSPLGSLRNWIVWILLTFVLPFITHKWGSLLLLKNKVDAKIETSKQAVKAIANIAENADKVIDSITDNLPNDSQLKKNWCL